MNPQPQNERKKQELSDDNLETFVEETHLDLVMRMMHFYDVLLLDGKVKQAAKNIGDVLRLIGWDKMSDEVVKSFLLSIKVDPKSANLKKEEVRTIFKKWIERVASEAKLLCECFRFFDIDNDGSISRDEIIKIFYRTTEEMRIKLIDNVISKLDEGVYYYEELGLKPKTVRRQRKWFTTKQSQSVIKEELKKTTLWNRIVNRAYSFGTQFIHSLFLEFLLAWALILFVFVPFIDMYI